MPSFRSHLPGSGQGLWPSLHSWYHQTPRVPATVVLSAHSEAPRAGAPAPAPPRMHASAAPMETCCRLTHEAIMPGALSLSA